MVTFIDKQIATSNKGTTYYRVKTNDGKEGSVFSVDPPLQTPLDYDEKYNQQYNNYSWFPKAPAGSGATGGGFKKTFPNNSEATLKAKALECAKDWALLARQDPNVGSAVSIDSLIEAYKKLYEAIK